MAHILLIEPDRLLGRTYATSLQANSHTVELCSKAQAAIHAIDTKQPDVVILELQLADHNGIEFLYELRSYPEWQEVPIVIHTFVPNYLFSDNDQQMRNLGVIHYLYKPTTTLQRLNQVVETALETVRA